MTDRIYFYDTTLRDGAQTRGVDFSVADKRALAQQLDAFGIDYIEGGWPGANPTDDNFFGNLPPLKQAQMVAFGMTRRAGRSADNDTGLTTLCQSTAPAVCLVAKTWDFHVDIALNTTLEENLKLIADSVQRVVASGKEAILDAEHFFDGYKANPAYALACLVAAREAGARWITLCDTNGGTLPHEIRQIVQAVTSVIAGEYLGIHTHNDTGNAVANTLVAVEEGVRLVQGTLNGLGERCGNANLTTLIPTLLLKMGYTSNITPERLTTLKRLSHTLDDRLNRPYDIQAPFVGVGAFSHKGGLHVSAVTKAPQSYEHIDPSLVGNERSIVVSDQAGRSNVLSRLQELGIALNNDDPRIDTLVKTIKQREFEGYSYDSANASLELLARQALGDVQTFFTLQSFRVLVERRGREETAENMLSEATVKVQFKDDLVMTVAEGNGPVNALDGALRKALIPRYPSLETIQLVDYKVRILTPEAGTAAAIRVLIESYDTKTQTHWTTIGVSNNVIDASYNALFDSICYHLMRCGG